MARPLALAAVLLGAAAAPSPLLGPVAAGSGAQPWRYEEEPVVRLAGRPDLCLTAAGAALELRACGSAPGQELAAPAGAVGPLSLGGACARPQSKAVAAEIAEGDGGEDILLESCAGAASFGDFAFPPSGHGSIRWSPRGVAGSGVDLCLALEREPAAGVPVGLRPCSGGDLRQSFLLPRRGAGTFLGVNLGGWLVLESWMWPGEMMARGLDDEHSFVAEHGGPGSELARDRMHRHWDTFLRPEHLDRLRRFGVTHVRIPFGYWLLDAVYDEEDGFVSGGEPFLARALTWLKLRGMRAVLDLHAMPGAQALNQSFTGKMSGVENFFVEDAEYARGKRAIQALVELVNKYEAHRATSGVVVGLELLNEPSHRHILRTQEFYSDMVPLVRRSLPAERFFVMLSFMDSPHSASMAWLARQIERDPGNWSGVAYDPHLYHLFGDNSEPWSEEQDFCKTCCRDAYILRPEDAPGVPTIVGEYSVATGFEGWHNGDFVPRNLHNYLSLWTRAESVVGSFLWNFRILPDPADPMLFLEWSLLDMVDLGYLEPHFGYARDLSQLCPGMHEATPLARAEEYDMSYLLVAQTGNGKQFLSASGSVLRGAENIDKDDATWLAHVDKYDPVELSFVLPELRVHWVMKVWPREGWREHSDTFLLQVLLCSFFTVCSLVSMYSVLVRESVITQVAEILSRQSRPQKTGWEADKVVPAPDGPPSNMRVLEPHLV